jgi:broad specificity phosphatase PhoE
MTPPGGVMKGPLRVLLSVLILALTVSAARAQTVVVLVRHAEKVDESAGSELTAAGQARARSLAALLKDAGIQAVFSTDYRRTLDTAKPTAEAISKRIEIYDGDDLAAFARTLRARGDRALVVGHSDTTPELVSLLGGESGPPIDSDEFDRIYLLTLFGDGKASTTVLRFPSGVEK